jgi:RNA polymerase sporulation-specific sigma factor
MYVRKNNARRVEVSIDEPLNTDWDGNELLLSDVLGTDEDAVYKDIEASEDRKIILEAISKLTKREQKIVNLRYGLNGEDEKTQKEVADELGISQSYISRLEKKIIKRLRKEIETKI